MAILAQYNILKFYTDRLYAQWERTENREIPIVFLATNNIPAFQIIVSAATTATFQILDVDGNEKLAAPSSVTVTDLTTYKRLKYNGGTLSGAAVLVAGYYQIKVTNGAETYYSDYFAWTTSTNLAKLLKVEATTANFALGRKSDWVFDTTSITYLCYLNVTEYMGITPAQEEEANENNGVVVPYYTSLSKSRAWVIDGNEHIYEYLLGLRVLQMNGVVKVTWLGVEYTANDIVVEMDENHGNFDLVDVRLEIRPYNDVMTVINEV
jgi:hypothetical protein